MISLVLGGARSGKSEVAERLAASHGEPVTYIATGSVADPDMAARVDEHRRRRPTTWRTVEPGADLADVLTRVDGPAIVDSLGTWVAGVEGFSVDSSALAAAMKARGAPTIVVSDEVGLGVHPATDAGRRFRDALGKLNRDVAAIADEVLLVVAGRVLRLDEAG